MNLVVISCAKDPSPYIRERCKTSVRTQLTPAIHLYLDDPGPLLEKVYYTVHGLHPSDVVCMVDGDDWLATEHALSCVHQAYDDGAWMTWGSYFLQDAPVADGISHDVHNRRACRSIPWFASHLKTFRAGLFQQIQKEHLHYLGHWLPQCTDKALMFPMLEMAAEHGRFIPQAIYIYDPSGRRARGNDTPGTPLHQEMKACESFLRDLPVYPRLKRAPW